MLQQRSKRLKARKQPQPQPQHAARSISGGGGVFIKKHAEKTEKVFFIF